MDNLYLGQMLFNRASFLLRPTQIMIIKLYHILKRESSHFIDIENPDYESDPDYDQEYKIRTLERTHASTGSRS